MSGSNIRKVSGSTPPPKQSMWRQRLLTIIAVVMVVTGIGLAFRDEIRNYLIYPWLMERVNNDASKLSGDDILGNKDRNIHPIYDSEQVTTLDFLPRDNNIRTDYLNGYLIIPSVDLKIPVLEGIDNKNMAVASGTMKPNQEMGERNYAIAGHHIANPKLLFSPVRNVQVGDKLYLTDKRKVYEYKTTNTFMVADREDDVINDVPKKRYITLVTCETYWGGNRYIVRGELSKVYDYKKAPKASHV